MFHVTKTLFIISKKRGLDLLSMLTFCLWSVSDGGKHWWRLVFVAALLQSWRPSWCKPWQQSGEKIIEAQSWKEEFNNFKHAITNKSAHMWAAGLGEVTKYTNRRHTFVYRQEILPYFVFSLFCINIENFIHTGHLQRPALVGLIACK